MIENKKYVMYNIYINQFAFMEHFPSLDLVDMVIYNYIYELMNSKATVSKVNDSDTFHWISSQRIIDSLPCLKINNKRTISRHIDNLISVGLLNKSICSEENSRTYYSSTEKSELLIFSKEKVVEEIKLEEGGCTEKYREGVLKSTGGCTEKYNDSYYSSLNTNNSYKIGVGARSVPEEKTILNNNIILNKRESSLEDITSTLTLENKNSPSEIVNKDLFKFLENKDIFECLKYSFSEVVPEDKIDYVLPKFRESYIWNGINYKRSFLVKGSDPLWGDEKDLASEKTFIRLSKYVDKLSEIRYNNIVIDNSVKQCYNKTIKFSDELIYLKSAIYLATGNYVDLGKEEYNIVANYLRTFNSPKKVLDLIDLFICGELTNNQEPSVDNFLRKAPEYGAILHTI